MSKFYIKNKDGEFLPVKLSSIMNEDLHNRLIIISVGTDEHPISKNDLRETVRSFEEANVINKIRNISVVITPYQIEVSLENKDVLNEKTIYLQIRGEDIPFLEDETKELYRRIKKQHSNVTVLPSPLRIKDYQYVKDILKRCKIKKERRGKVK